MCNSSVKVSVIMPSLNVGKYIAECIESAINQTLKDIEIICVDAGSTDGTLEILKEYEKKDSRVKVIVSDVKSYGRQINLGFAVATGQYMAILETDDCIKPDMYEVLYNTAIETDADIVKTDFESFVDAEDGRKYSYFSHFKDKSAYNKIFTPIHNPDSFSSNPSTWSSVYKMSFLKENNIRHNETPGASYQDTSFWVLTLAAAKKAYFMDRAFYMLRRDRNESSVFNRGKIYAIFDEYNFIDENIPNDIKNDENYIKVYWKKKCDHFIYHYNRIADDSKLFYLCRMSEEFKKSYENNEIDLSLLNKNRKKDIEDIILHPREFYARADNQYNINAKKEKDNLEKEIRKIKKENDKIKKEFTNVINSRSYKVGRIITFIPRKIRGGIRCLNQNGIRYTIKRIILKIKDKTH